MCLGKKRNKIYDEDKELVVANSKAISVLTKILQDEEFVTRAEQIQIQLKFLTPSNNNKVMDCDKKIRNILEDLKIIVVKNNHDKVNDAIGTLYKIEVLIAERRLLL